MPNQRAEVTTFFNGNSVTATSDAAGKYMLASMSKNGAKTVYFYASCTGYEKFYDLDLSIERSPGNTGPAVMVTCNIELKKTSAAVLSGARAPQWAHPAGEVSIYTISGKKIGTCQASTIEAFEHGRASGPDARSNIVILRYESNGRSVCRKIVTNR